MKFRVKIRKEGAPDSESVIEAPSRFAVYAQVQHDGGVVTELTEVGGGFRLPAWLFLSFGAGIKRLEIIHMAKNLSTMLSAGLSLSRALSVIERQSSNKRFKAILQRLGESVQKGSSFHEALAQYPRIFSPLFIAMTKAGEESGSLAESFSVVSLQMERADTLVRKIRGAMIYPAIVIVAIVIVAVLMLIYVVPTLTKTFASFGVAVPLSTQIIVAISDFMAANVLVALLSPILLVVVGSMFVRSRRGSAVALSVALRLPVIGELVRETYSARTARTLSSLLAAGVPILETLAITKEVVRARAFADVIAEAEARVKKGEALSASFSEHEKLYPILMSEMLLVGEETGKVTDMLKQIAEFYEGDVAEKTKDLSTIIEPVLMLFIGAVVGVFAVSMIAPIYQLSSAI